MNTLVQVVTVYGDKYLVSASDLSSGRTQLPLYLKTGRKVSDHRERMGWKFKPCTLHRDNIKEVA